MANIAAEPGQSRVALISIGASALLALLKLGVAGESGSLALLGSALDAGIDIGVTAVTYVVVKAAERPADQDHHFGHARFESLAALLQTLVLIGVGGFVVHSALKQISGSAMTMQPERTPLAVGTLLLSCGIDFWRFRALGRAAQHTGSPALAAAALSFRLDFLTTCFVLVSIASVGGGFRLADPLAAGAIGVIMLVSAYRLLRQTLDGMTDRAPEGMADRARAAAASVPGAAAIVRVRVRRLGAQSYAEITVAVDGNHRFRDVQLIKDAVSAAVVAALDGAECVVMAIPR